MKKSFMKKIFVFTLTCVLTLGAISASAFAKTRDFYDSSTNTIYSSPATMSTADFNNFMNLVMDHPDKFVYEFNGKYYNYNAMLSDYMAKHKTLGVVDAFNACLANSADIQQSFDPSAYGTNPTNPDDSDFSVISID